VRSEVEKAFADTTVRPRHRWVLLVLGALLLVSIILGVSIGAFSIPLGDLIPAILGQSPDTANGQLTNAVIWDIRLPRVVLAGLIGACLAVAGVIMQGIFANPLAEPALVGVSSGAAVGAVGAIVIGATAFGAWVLPTAAFAGGLIVTTLVYTLSRVNGRSEVLTLLLTGIAVNAFCGAVIGLLMSVSDDDELRSITFWSLGSVSLATWPAVLTVVPFAVLAFIAAPFLARPLDLLALGERSASHLGLDVERIRRLAIVVTALLTAAAVAIAGIIGFVGLVVPHAVRLVVGPGHRLLLPASALAGAALLVLADLISRTVVAPREIPLGVLTALIGAPVFFWLLRREHKRRGAWA